MDLMYFIINGLTLFILLYIYLEKKLNHHKILTLVGQILACTSLVYNLRNYAYAVFTVYVFNYLISIFSINRKLLLKDIVFTFVCILIQQISLLILMSIHMPYSQYISCFILLIVGILFIRLLKKYELDINIKQWWHFFIIGYIHSLSLYCFVIVYLKELKTEFVFLIFGFTALSILYIYLFRTIIKENQIKIDYEKNNLRRIHKNELNKVYYDIHNKEHQLYYIAYSIQNSIETHNTKEALETINHYIESLDKTKFVIYSHYSYFNMKFSALINSYKIKNVNVVVFINSIENKRFESKRFVNDLCLLIEDFVIEFYDSQAIHIQISQENNFTCLSLYTNTSIVNKNFISHQKLLNQYSYSFHNDNFTILKMIID